MPSFAEKLEALFQRTGVSPEDVAEKTGISTVYLWKLRTGRSTNPGYNVIEALAEFFNVDTSYFFNFRVKPKDTHEAETDELGQTIALRASQLDERVQQTLLDMIDHVRDQKAVKRQKKGDDGGE